MRIVVTGLILAAFMVQSAGAATLVVSNTNDLVNGDTSNPQALIGNPGSDGISLREAFLAVNNVPGPHTVTFAPGLAGQTIVPTTRFAPITRDQITVTGLTNNGQPNITIDARQSVGAGCTLFVAASQFSISGLHFTFAPPGCAAIQIGGFGYSLTGQPISAPSQISGFRITGNAFSNAGGTGDGFAIFVSTSVNETNGATIKNVVIADNTFSQLYEAINVQGGGNNNLIEDVVIYGNTFTNNTSQGTSAVELGNTVGSNNKIRRARILQNTFTGNFMGIALNNSASVQNSLIEDTLIARNVFVGNLQAFNMSAGVDVVSINNAIANTRIVDNLVRLTGFNGQVGAATIQIFDNQGGGTNNRVTGVSFVNNTINGDGPPGAGVWVTSTGGVSGVAISNSIFWGSSNDELKGVTPSQVQNSIINQSGFAGVNGNIGSDPMFVNPAAGDFHLQSGSPARGAGTSAGAPFGDLDCQPRNTPPSIGAYELTGPAVCTQIVPLAAVLPASRSVQTGNLATAFATILNIGNATAKACGLAPATSLPAGFIFQTTDPATNAANGTPNSPVDIGAGAAQTYVFGLNPSGAFPPTDVALEFTCANTLHAPTTTGVNTLLLSASNSPVPDMIAVGLTPSNDGVARVPGVGGTGIFVIASTNIGIAAPITARARLSDPTMPVTTLVCETNPSDGQCKQPASPTVSRSIGNNENTTWTAFLQGNGLVPFDPARARVFFEFVDGGGAVRGSTSAAVLVQ